MKKNVVIIIIVLVVIIGVTAFLNRGSLWAKNESQEDALITIISDGSETTFNMIEIKQLGETEFEAVLDTSDSGPSAQTYTGVPLLNVIDAGGVDMDGRETVIVKAVDGYTAALSADEVQDEDNVYLVYAQNGEPLGKKEDGGRGPYQVIIRKDQFSQRWCKFVMEIEIQ